MTFPRFFKVLLGNYLFLALLVGRQLGYNDLLPRAQSRTSDLKGFNVKEIEFLGKGGIKLRGWFVKSEQNPSGKTLLVLHGYRRSRQRILEHIKLFVESGFHVFAYDQRAHGASDTAFITFGVDESDDLLLALKAMQDIPEINMERLGAVGLSLGSSVIVYALNKKAAPPFKAVVLEGVFAKSYDVGRKLLENYFGERGSYIIGTLFFTFGTQMWALGKFRHSEPYKYIQAISPTPLMIIRGQNDHLVYEQSARQIIDFAGEPKTIWIHEHGDHTRSLSTYPAQYKDRVINFLASCLDD